MTTRRNTSPPTSSDRYRTLPIAVASSLVAVLGLLGACTGGEVARVEAGHSIPADAPTPRAAEGSAHRQNVRAVPPELLVARAFCAAHRDVGAPGGVERLVSLMSEDVVVSDAVAGTRLDGHAAVRDRLSAADPDRIHVLECGATLRAGSWVAIAARARSSAADSSLRGIVAVRVAGSRVEEQVNHLTLGSDADGSLPSRPVEGHRVVDYCTAWDHGAAPDAVMSFLTPGASLETVVTVVGRERIGEYAEHGFPYDRNECDEGVVEHGDWAAGTSRLTMTDAGVAVDALSIVWLDEAGLIGRHLLYPDVPGS